MYGKVAASLYLLLHFEHIVPYFIKEFTKYSLHVLYGHILNRKMHTGTRESIYLAGK